ncbi:MAG: MATE family efflux transporter [Treponema sp.]|nr:MATE family efflux transporter [Treponema sp.]
MQNKSRGALPMVKLALPLAGEQLLRIVVSLVDTFMLSSYCEEAVAGVGLVSQWIFFLQILFNIVAIGSSIVLAQYLGAQRSKDDLNNIAKASAIMVGLLSLVLTAAVFLGTGLLLGCYKLEDSVRSYAKQYFLIFGGAGAVFNAVSLLQSSILRCYGYTRENFIVTLVANFVNVVGNALSLYGWFGLPVLGVAGVAGASLLASMVSCVILGVMIKRRKDVCFNLSKVFAVPRKFFALILKVGIPTAGENLSYNISQIVIMAMISSLGTYAMSAQVYTNTLARFVFVIAIGIGAAVQIKTGYYVGAGESDTAYRKVFRYGLCATCASIILVLLLNLVKGPAVGIFTKNEEIIGMVSKVLIISILLEFGRSLNLIYVGALKGAGDIRFPVLYGMFSNWCIMVLGAYILGLRLGFGIYGCFMGIALDETTRGFVMLLRWKSKRWMTKALV